MTARATPIGSIPQCEWNLCQGHQDAALDVELGDRLVVVVVDLGALDRLQRFERGDRRE
jgi:hypothetical protein